MGRSFYAVRKGAKPGVYATWDECKSQVDKFPCASYKKFASEKDAWAFVRGVKPPDTLAVISEASRFKTATVAHLPPKRSLEYIPLGRKRSRSQTEEFPSKKIKTSSDVRMPTSAGPDGLTYKGDAVVVYTDGCCFGNGQRGARAGIGVYWGPEHPLNVAERLRGRQTNQRAELQAACRALEQAKDVNVNKLILYTDSMFTINGVTSWVKNWKRNGWRLKSGGEVVNKDDFVRLDKLNAELQVVWLHVPGHAGYKGNEQADRLSKEGAAKPL